MVEKKLLVVLAICLIANFYIKTYQKQQKTAQQRKQIKKNAKGR